MLDLGVFCSNMVLAGCLRFWSGQPDLGACPVLCIVVCLEQIRVLVPARLVCSGFGPARSFLQVDLFWPWPWWLGSVSLVEVGLFFEVSKGWLLPGVCWVLCQRSVCRTWRDC